MTLSVSTSICRYPSYMACSISEPKLNNKWERFSVEVGVNHPTIGPDLYRQTRVEILHQVNAAIFAPTQESISRAGLQVIMVELDD